LKKQRAKRRDTSTLDGSHSLNDLLDNLQSICQKSYLSEKAKGIPTPEKLRDHLTEFLGQNLNVVETKNQFFDLIDRFVKGDIKNKGRDKSKNTLNNYNTARQHLLGYETKNKTKLTFESITLDFFYDYVSYLKTLNGRKGKGLSPNTIAKDITVLKVFMSEAVDLRYTTNLEFKHKKFTISEEETDSVYLTEKEILELYKFDFSQNKKLDQVRDLFVFGCFVGLRFSDFSAIKRENIVSIDKDLFIKVITNKTKDLVIIPCNSIVLEILKKYHQNNNSLPKSVSKQKFNEYIKEVCEKAGFNEKGRLSTEPNKSLFECISSHTARRSFATNYYLQGFPTIDLMKITGHKTEKAFMKYIKVTKLDAAKRLNVHMKKRWSEKVLKIA
jgi:integrase